MSEPDYKTLFEGMRSERNIMQDQASAAEQRNRDLWDALVIVSSSLLTLSQDLKEKR